jgi:hypothetical protein
LACSSAIPGAALKFGRWFDWVHFALLLPACAAYRVFNASGVVWFAGSALMGRFYDV